MGSMRKIKNIYDNYKAPSGSDLFRQARKHLANALNRPSDFKILKNVSQLIRPKAQFNNEKYENKIPKHPESVKKNILPFLKKDSVNAIIRHRNEPTMDAIRKKAINPDTSLMDSIGKRLYAYVHPSKADRAYKNHALFDEISNNTKNKYFGLGKKRCQ